MSSFENKVVLVTGASSGIGRATAILFASKGARVAVMARNTKKLEELRKEVADPKNLLIIPGDVSRESDCRKTIQTILKQWKGVDAVIHNAGISMRGIAQETETSVFVSLMETNYYSLVYLYKESVQALRLSKGHFVSVSSMMGKYSTQLRSGYAASKHAMIGFMDSVRLEMITHGVHVMSVLPGFVNTEISKNAFGADGKKRGTQDKAIAAGLSPDHVALDIYEGMEYRKREVVSSHFKEKFALFISKWAPGILDRLLLKIPVT